MSGVNFLNVDDVKINETYHLQCLVQVKDISYEDFQSKGELGIVTEKMVFLLPQHNTQRDLFFDAWLPDYTQDPKTKEIVPGHNEVACKSGHPIYGFYRASVHRADKRVPEQPYLFVMSRSSEEEFKAMDGKTVEVIVLPDSNIEKADLAKDFEVST